MLPIRPSLLSLLTMVCGLAVAGCGSIPLPVLGGAELAIQPGRVALLEGDTMTLRLRGAGDGEASWESADTSVVQVVEPGRIAAVGVGRTLVYATVGEERARAFVYVDQAVLVGAGDIAVCGYEADELTAELLDEVAGIIWTAGDNAYPSGTIQQYMECYHPTWGPFKERTRPSPGNHEYRTPNAAGYFEYYGDVVGEAGKGWYAYEYGGWLVLALNSNFSYLSGALVDEQLEWLEEQLAASDALCTLAYFHHPLVSSGAHGGNEDELDDENVRPIWERLYAAGADVVLVGHDHHYERFAPLDARGVIDPDRGIRQFIVGTGGASLRGHGTAHPNSEVFNNSVHGLLELVLREDGYEWQFLAVDGRGVDSGSDRCH